MTSSRLWLLAPAAILYVTDVGLTLAGQSAAYWAGDYGTAVEANPIAHLLLAHSPWLFVGLAVVWLALFSVVLIGWQHPWVGWVAVIVATAHAIGGASWLARHGGWGLVAAIAYITAVSQASGWCWRRYAQG